MQKTHLTSREYLESLEPELIDALKDIITMEKETKRLIRKNASEDFIEDLCQIIDNYSSHWVKGDH